ncbi:hypothetical protein EVAR_61882_1 [Eumeta japonica]|uniref:Mariner Mos1 transposase n=1 Tax=Eumeta variegata TaxID=151549 RepID=A0A4C1YV25_EUMVA|nr:hypothetical protein EVAR_61882_1 [Eumeta japonica]
MLCTRWTPYNLSEAKKLRRVNWCREMIQFANGDSSVVFHIVTCDESWSYCYDLGTKRQSAQWVIKRGREVPNFYQTNNSLEEVGEKRPHNRIFFRHDNGSLHTARQTNNYLGTLGIKMLAHPPYRSDLATKQFLFIP